MSELAQFYAELLADVVAEATSAGGSQHHNEAFKENAFTRILLDDLDAAGVLESPTPCYVANSASRMPYKINAYGIPDEDSRLDLVIADFRAGDVIQKLTSPEIERSFKQALRFLSVATEEGARVADAGHEEHAMLGEIYEKRETFDRVQLILVTNAQAVQRKEKERRDIHGRYKISYEIWDLERLRRFRSSGATHEPVAVDFTDLEGGGLRCVPVSDDALGYQSCVAIVPGRVLYELYEEHGARLLELNVRSYLQARGKINAGILQTLLLTPQLFLAYNNGITIVAEAIHLDSTGTVITGINGLQIVNGGQTTASIHRAHKESSADLSHVFVQAKLTVVPSGEFEALVPEISRLSNTQNKVSTVDLRANHAFHIGVERVARKTWAPGEQSMWFYERARGAFQTERSRHGRTDAQRAAFDKKFPASQRITKEELARYTNTWDRLPHVVSRGGQKNFEKFMTGVKKVDKGWEPSKEEFKALVGKAILFRRTQQLAKELGIKAFGINIVTYTIALLSHVTSGRVQLSLLWERQDLTPALSAQLREWLPKVAAELVASAGTRNPGEWFKSEQCWQHLRSAASGWSMADGMAAELGSVGEGYEDVPADVQNSIARCMRATAETWFRIQIWGSESKKLLFWQTGIANTLAGYAGAGWKRLPSPKQARHGVQMLELYEEAQQEVA